MKDKQKIVFIGGMFPKSIIEEIECNSRGPIQYAADALQKSLVTGIREHFNDVELLNLPFIGSWPSLYKSLFSPNSYVKEERNQNSKFIFKNFRFLNIRGIKMLSRYSALKKELFKLCKANKNEKIIYLVIYSLHTPFLKAAVEAKNRYKFVKIISVVPDLPEYMSASTNIFRDYMVNKNVKLQNKLYNTVDGFILLTEWMKDRVVVKDQPVEIIEGIFDSSSSQGEQVKDEFLNYQEKSVEKKIIFYSGTLAARYNILSLVEAVRRLDRGDVELHIYGDGDTRTEIERIASVDSKIKYCGQKSREEILRKQQEAFLLVNPRTADGEYTKYSFPSKTMEYLGSGTPVLLYKLPGIPEEYYDYCFSLEDPGIDSLSKKIDDILNMDNAKLAEYAKAARNFILNEKDPVTQTEKLVKLLERI